MRRAWLAVRRFFLRLNPYRCPECLCRKRKLVLASLSRRERDNYIRAGVLGDVLAYGWECPACRRQSMVM